MDLIITSGHGGFMTPDKIRNRNRYGCRDEARNCRYSHDCTTQDTTCRTVTGIDMKSMQLAKRLREKIYSLTGKSPHLVLNNLERIKLDPNREVQQASFGDPASMKAWGEYHGFIEEAKGKVGRGLLVDIHGQSHKEQWIELGYVITKSDLNAENITPNRSSIRLLAEEHPEKNFLELIYGDPSLGGMMQEKGYKAVPSPKYKTPGAGGYYRGGYTTQRHGSFNATKTDAIQIEVNSNIRTNEELRNKCADDLAVILVDYLKKYYGFEESQQNSANLMQQRKLHLITSVTVLCTKLLKTLNDLLS